MILAIPLSSLAVAASVKDVSLVPNVGLEEMEIIGAVLSTTGGAVICSVIILDVALLAFVELSVATAVIVCVPMANVCVIVVPVPI